MYTGLEIRCRCIGLTPQQSQRAIGRIIARKLAKGFHSKFQDIQRMNFVRSFAEENGLKHFRGCRKVIKGPALHLFWFQTKDFQVDSKERRCQGCQIVYIQTKNAIWVYLQRKMFVYIFYGHLVYFTDS
jgi:hypothetical protein